MFAHNKLGKNLFDINTNGEQQIAKTILQEIESGYIFDIGANKGEWTENILKFSKDLKILVFEPNPNLFTFLEQKFVDKKNIMVNKLALGNIEEYISFYMNEDLDSHGNNSLYQHYYLQKTTNKVNVRCSKLDTFCSENNIDRIRYIKADIEGSEIDLLRGAQNMLKNNNIDYLQLEYNQTWIQAGGSLQEVFENCKKYGYSLYRIAPKGLIKISFYTYTLDDFVFQNLLMVSNKVSLKNVKIFSSMMPRPKEVSIELN